MVMMIRCMFINSVAQSVICVIISFRVNAGIQTRMLISCSPEASDATVNHSPPPPLSGAFTQAEDHEHRLLQCASEVRDHASRLQTLPEGDAIYRRLVRDLFSQYDFNSIERPLNADMGYGPSLVSNKFDDYAKVGGICL